MNGRSIPRCFVGWWLVTAFVLVGFRLFAGQKVFLGPANPGLERGQSNWFCGAQGAATLSLERENPADGACGLSLGNTVAQPGNCADWRSEQFSLGPATGGVRPISFSFLYKLPDSVASGDNLWVQLRFFDATGTNFKGEKNLLLGAASGDSAMTMYKRYSRTDIFAPPAAQVADIRISANLFGPWGSGAARFDNFAVTTLPGHGKWLVLGSLLVLMSLGGACWWQARVRAARSG